MRPRRRWLLLLIPVLAFGWWLHARQQDVGPDIIFVSNRSGEEEIYRMHANGTGVRRIIPMGERYDPAPVVSPEGKYIAYVENHVMYDFSGIYTTDIDGSNSQEVTRDERYNAVYKDPSFFPDGHSLIFSAYRNSSRNLFRINLDGTCERQLTFGKQDDWSPVVSPDGTFILYVSEHGENGDIYRMNADGSGLRQLTKHPTHGGFPAMSPDGQRIALVSKGEIYLMDSNGLHLRRLTHETGSACDPAFSPNGKQIAYTLRGNGYTDICVINTDGRGRKVLTNNWLRAVLRQRLGNNKLSRFLGLTGGFEDKDPVWVPPE